MTIDMSKQFMSNHDKQTDNLDALFSTARDNEAYLADDGFSDIVISSLPSTSGQSLSNWKKNALIVGATALGSLATALLAPAINLPIGELLASMPPIGIGVSALLTAAAGLFGLSGLALWAHHKELI